MVLPAKQHLLSTQSVDPLESVSTHSAAELDLLLWITPLVQPTPVEQPTTVMPTELAQIVYPMLNVLPVMED